MKNALDFGLRMLRGGIGRAMKLLAGSSLTDFSQRVSEFLGEALTKVELRTFSDGESCPEIKETIRGEDIFILQSTAPPVNDRLMELLLMIDAAKRAGGRCVTAVIPYFGYARQDRKLLPRTPISARLVANLLETAGVNRVLTMDLHAVQIQGFFNIPVDNLSPMPTMTKRIRETFGDCSCMTVVSPDIGGVKRARDLASLLNVPIGIADKRRDIKGQAHIMHIIGDIKGRVCLLTDDIIDSASTLCKVGERLMSMGAKACHAYVTHGLLSGEALERIETSPLQSVVISDTIAQREVSAKIQSVSVAPLIGEAVRRISRDCSVSSLFPTIS